MTTSGEPLFMAVKKASQAKKDDEAMNELLVKALKSFTDSVGDQKKAAERLGYSQGQVSRLLAKKNKPTRGLLFALVRASGRDPNNLLGVGQSAPPAFDPGPLMTEVDDLKAIVLSLKDEIHRLGGNLPALLPRSTIRTKEKKED